MNIHSIKRQIIKYLWSLGLREKETSLMLCFNFLSGCRVNDLKYANFSDLVFEQNDSGKYVSIPLKISKTNPMSLKTEQITVLIKQNTIWDVEYKLNYIKEYRLKNKLKLHRIFTINSTSGFVYQMEKGRINCGFSKKLSGHSGRNSVLKRMLLAEVSDDNICLSFNWKRDSEMLFRYRNSMIERSNRGAQFLLDKFDNENGLALL